ncbi:MAG: WD40/YVTN/BNR-like repeat-containing protein [Candidatus Baltobacteraceae bacterium]
MYKPLIAGALLVFCCAATPAPDPLAQLTFRNVGPQVSGGRLGAVAGSDLDPSLYYAGAAGGGVWRTTNAGGTWSPVFDQQDVQSIGAIAIDPVNPQTVWVGTGEGAPRNDVIQGDGVYRTDDAGKTWHHALSLHNALVAKIVIDPKDPMNVLVGVLGDPFAASVDRGIYRSSDGGRTWKKTLYISPRTGVSDMSAADGEPGVVYAGMWEYRRTGWSSESGGTGGGLYKSADFGATWQRLSGGGLPTGATGRIGVAVAPSNAKRIFALIESKQGLLWRSDDGGVSWKMISASTLMDERPFYYTHVFVDPTDQNHVWTLSVHVAVSKDGGATWKVGARGVHGDNHAMWISRDAKRIIEANDGGPSFSFDNGNSWTMPHNLPIAQLYHIGYDRQTPYHICAPLQDNGVWCAPNNPLGERGITASDWRSMGGGDGTFVMPDPADPQVVWFTSGGGNAQGELSHIDLRTNVTQVVQPYLRDQNVVPPKDLAYRFNWETPFAFDPFDPHRVWVAGNVVFASTDRGMHWKAVSGDLTRNNRAHETMTGGITLDVTGAETSETILALAPSRAARGEIWAGTDDGLVQLTTDAGAHWKTVLTKGYGRMASISPSTRDPRTAYVVYDAHMIGDRTPHVYVTQDLGASWRDISGGLPLEPQAHAVLVDPRNPQLVYVGTDAGLWASFNGGANWRKLSLNMPAVAVRDIAVHPDTDDLLLATHGRSVFVFDDLTPLQQWQTASGPRLFPVRAVYQWNTHSFYATRTDGAGPPYGAIITFYLDRADKNARGEVLDARGHAVRHFTAKELTGQAGFNRFTWDTSEDKPVDWRFTPQWNQGIGSGPAVLPGTYSVVVHASAQTLRTNVVVRQDPRTHYTASQLRTGHDEQRQLTGDFGRVNVALNMLSTVTSEAPLRAAALVASGQTKLAQAATRAGAQAKRLLLTITENPVNDQDNDFLRDILRERLQSALGYTPLAGPLPESQRLQNAALHALTNDRMNAVKRFETATLRALDAQLAAQKLASLEKLTAMPQIYNPDGP